MSIDTIFALLIGKKLDHGSDALFLSTENYENWKKKYFANQNSNSNDVSICVLQQLWKCKIFFPGNCFYVNFFDNVQCSKRQRLQIIPDALHIQTSETLSLEIPIGKHLAIMVLIFIFMGHTLVRFCYQCGKKYIIFHRQQNSNEKWSNN